MSIIRSGTTSTTRLSIESDNSDSIIFTSSQSNLLNITNQTVSILGSHIVIPVGDDNNRSANPVAGEIRFNTSIGKVEGYNGVYWANIQV
jgi:hypothetical protein